MSASDQADQFPQDPAASDRSSVAGTPAITELPLDLAVPPLPHQSAGPDPTSTPVETLATYDEDPPRRRWSPGRWSWRRWVVAAVAIVLVLAAGAFALRVSGASKDQQYLKELEAQGLAHEYPSDVAALAQGHAFCTTLTSGAALQGYKSQLVAVRHFCPMFVAGFKVIPTPAEQQADFTGQLRKAGLGGEYSSDAAAVAHANAVCGALDKGGPQQGPPADAIAVGVYCPGYTSGFRTLQAIPLKGSLTLYDFSSSIYSMGIVATGGRCEGFNGYSDIRAGQEVRITDGDGDLLARTVLGGGKGGSHKCRFTFSTSVMEGEDDYVVAISHRGSWHFTEAEVKLPDSLQFTLGL